MTASSSSASGSGGGVSIPIRSSSARRSRSTAAALPSSGSCRRSLSFRCRFSACRAGPLPSAPISGSRSRLRKNELESRGSRSYGVIGRLKPGVTQAQAQAEADTILANWHPLFPDNYEPATKFGATLYPMHELVVGGMRPRAYDFARRGRRRSPDRLRESHHHAARARRGAGARVRDSRSRSAPAGRSSFGRCFAKAFCSPWSAAFAGVHARHLGSRSAQRDRRANRPAHGRGQSRSARPARHADGCGRNTGLSLGSSPRSRAANRN